MRSFVKTGDGKHILREVEPIDQLLDLKGRLQDKESISPDRLHWIFGVTALQDYLIVEDCSILMDSAIHMCSTASMI
jgi:ubiquitin-like protein Nedd8